MITPATQHLIESINPELLFVQVLIQSSPMGYGLRHCEDRGKRESELRLIDIPGLRNLSMFNARGAFRPLKCAPDLIHGWLALARNSEELERSMEMLYPGCVADWHAAQLPDPSVTHYREFSARQSGMYRITNLLNDELAAQVGSSCCDAQFCLRRRLWTVGTLRAEAKESKSLAPCLEPCAILLELARKALRLEQEEKDSLRLASDEWSSVVRALEWTLNNPPHGSRTGDFADPSNPRRLRLLLEKLRAQPMLESVDVKASGTEPKGAGE